VGVWIAVIIKIVLLILLSTYILPCQQEIKREWNEHLISPDMVTKESFSAQRGRRAAAGFLSIF
jgi:hypothetical protein